MLQGSCFHFCFVLFLTVSLMAKCSVKILGKHSVPILSLAGPSFKLHTECFSNHFVSLQRLVAFISLLLIKKKKNVSLLPHEISFGKKTDGRQ